jgi:hypothetical protein
VKSKDWNAISTLDPHNDVVGNNLKRLDGVHHAKFSDARAINLPAQDFTREDQTLEMLKRELEKLRQVGIKAEISELKMASGFTARAITGKFKNEPFCLYMKWCMRKDGEWMAIVSVRYKGCDYFGLKPNDVMK